MAVDMSNVKQIMHNNKEVIKIEDSLGHIIWQKVPEQPYRRLEYIAFDGTNYCDSAEHNANNRAFRLDYMQTGWNSSGLCYPFGIWSNTTPKNILLTRNERSNTKTGFEVCRIAETAFGTHPSGSYLNNRMVAEMRWGTDTTVYYRLRNQSSSDYIDDSSGAATWRNGTNTGNFFIGAINDGGGGTYSNANGMLVGKIYEVAIAGSNSFDDYGYAYVPCQRKSDGAIGFKQPHADFWPLRNKADGSIVTNVTAHMGPVVDDNWDGVTYTIEPSPKPPVIPAQWHTLWEGNQECVASAYWGSWTFTPSSEVTLCSIDTSTISDLSNVQCRITFSNMSAGGNSTSYTPSPKPSSPYTFTDITTTREVLKAEGIASNAAYWCNAKLRINRNGTTTNFIAGVSRSSRTAASNQSYSGKITITKIELYY